MPSQTRYPPARYSAHWVACFEWLATRQHPHTMQAILVEQAVRPKQLRYVQARLMSMVASAREFPGWSASIKTAVVDYKFGTRAVMQQTGDYSVSLVRYPPAQNLTADRVETLLGVKQDDAKQ